MTTEVKDIKMNQLTTAIKELNELLFKPGDKNRVKTVGVSKADAINGLKEMAAILNAEEGDKISQTTADLLGLLEIQIPEGVGIIGGATTPASPQTETKTKKESVKEEKKKEEKKKTKQQKQPVAKPQKYTRIQAFCDVLSECTKENPKSTEEIAKKMNEVYSKENPGKDRAKLVSTVWAVTDYIAPMLHLGFVKRSDDGKYYLAETTIED